MNFKSIKTKLIFTTVVLFAAVAVLLSLVSTYTNYSSTLETLKSTMSETAHIGANVVKTQIMVIDKLMSEIATSKTLTSDTMLLQKEAYLESKTKQYEEQYKCAIYYADAQGNNSITNKSVSGELFFKSAINGAGYLSKPFTRYDNTLGFIYSYPVKNYLNEITGVVYMEFDYYALYDAVSSANIGETGNSYVVDEERRIVLHRDLQLVEQRFSAADASKTDKSQLALAALQEKAANGESGFGEYSFNGENRVVAYAPIEGTSWSYFIAADRVEFMGGLAKSIILSIAACFAVAVVSVIAMAVLAMKITRPIKSVAQRVGKLAQGNLSEKVEIVKGRDEAALLAQGTAKTIETLKIIIDDIALNMHELASGNLTAEINSDAYVGEFAPIKFSLNNIIETLRQAMLQINEASEEVSSGAHQVSQAAQELSSGASEQASSVEELAATISEISGQINNVAKNADGAKVQTLSASTSLMSCNDRMAELNTAMSIISAKANAIGNIVKTIDEIAFQTNLLALNAAVEAARAGAAGKGFAVVAGEVRNLAAKSAEAVKSTTALIEETRTAVNNGARIADETGCALLQVVQGAALVSDAVNEISHSTNEQAAAILLVTNGMELISGVVQTNSATAEESAAASEELSSQAQLLKELVSHFKIYNDLSEQDEQIYNENYAHA